MSDVTREDYQALFDQVQGLVERHNEICRRLDALWSRLPKDERAEADYKPEVHDRAEYWNQSEWKPCYVTKLFTGNKDRCQIDVDGGTKRLNVYINNLRLVKRGEPKPGDKVEHRGNTYIIEAFDENRKPVGMQLDGKELCTFQDRSHYAIIRSAEPAAEPFDAEKVLRMLKNIKRWYHIPDDSGTYANLISEIAKAVKHG